MVLMAPKDENELQHMLKTAIDHNGPISIRYPRGDGWGVALEEELSALEIGKGEFLRPGRDILILGIGNTVMPAMGAATDLASLGIDAAVINARFVKPLDRELILKLVAQVSNIITVEDHVLQGGFGSALLEFLAEEEVTGVRVKCLGVPDRFIPHGTQEELRKICGIDKDGITQAALQMVRQERVRKKEGWQKGSV
jgi:1-deoxy-D-xylulose-5-phosphate synthase